MRRVVPLGVLVLFVSAAAAETTVTQADLFNRLVDLPRLMTPPPAGERCGVIASRPTDGEKRFVKQTPDGWNVIAELEGPGVVTHLWLDPPKGPFRVVVDGKTPVDVPLEELFAGQTEPFVAPFVSGGVSCYVPIGFTKQCTLMTKNADLAYEVGLTRFAAGTAVEPFTLPLSEAGAAAATTVKKILQEGPTDRQIFGEKKPMPDAVQQELGPDQKLTETLDKAGTLRAIYLALTGKTDPREATALHQVILRVFVDGEDQPSVEAPLAAFFGSGFEPVSFGALALGTNKDLRIPIPERRLGQDRFMYCLFPMPYRNGLRVEIENLNPRKKPIGVMLVLMIDTREPAADALRFNARFRRDDPCKDATFQILEASGRGRLVGCSLLADIPRLAWWGAGSLRVKPGNEKEALVGAGCDALFGGSGGGVALSAGAFEGVTRTGPYGKSAAYRLFVPDAIPFDQGLRVALDNRQEGDARDVYFGSVVYWYAAAGGRASFARLTEKDLQLPGFRLPGAVEIEGNIKSASWGNPLKAEFADAELSGGVAAAITTDKPVQINIPSAADRKVRLGLRIVPGRVWDKIIISDPAGKALKTLEYARAPEGIFEIGETTLKKGDNVFTVQCTKTAVLDCWIVEDAP